MAERHHQKGLIDDFALEDILSSIDTVVAGIPGLRPFIIQQYAGSANNEQTPKNTERVMAALNRFNAIDEYKERNE